MKKRLSELPNIGATLECKLIEAGIDSPQMLAEIGSTQAFLRLSINNKAACYNMLCALEGAIQEIRWHQLPPSKKQELKEFLELLSISK